MLLLLLQGHKAAIRLFGMQTNATTVLIRYGQSTTKMLGCRQRLS